MSDEKDFFIGYGAVPDKDKRFLLKAVRWRALGNRNACNLKGTDWISPLPCALG